MALPSVEEGGPALVEEDGLPQWRRVDWGLC